MPRKPEPTKFCATCDKQLIRKRYPSGSLESLRDFGERAYCDGNCAGEARATTPKQFREDAKGRREARRITEKLHCSRCQSTNNLHVHHRDENPQNNAEGNRVVLCNGCHQKQHRVSPPCVICGKTSRCREMCDMHYRRWKRHGSPLIHKINQYLPPIVDEPLAGK